MGQIYMNSVNYSTGGGSDAHSYSTTEQAVGLWVDGSTVYEKTIYISSVSLTQDAKQTIESSFVGNNILSVSGYNLSTNGTSYYSIPDGRLRVFIESGDLKLQSINGGTWNGEAYITIRYTKAST